MGSDVTISVLAAATGSAEGRGIAAAALICWLAAESLGAWMLGRWIAADGERRPGTQPGDVPRLVIFGHAGLALTGFACWVGFIVTGSAVAAWIAVGVLAPAIGLGISTVTVWTPYPAHREAAGRQLPAVSGQPPDGSVPGGTVPREMLTQALADEALTARLVDDLLARMLARSRPAVRRPRLDLAPLIPAAHGVLAIVTFLLAMLSATAAL
jgi:hypothetical protein